MAKDDIMYFDREDFYAYDVFEKEYGGGVCTCDCHHVEYDIWDSLECCRRFYGEKYLLTVDKKLYILRSFADKLLAEKAQNQVDHYRYYRRENNIEWSYRTPRHIKRETV